MFKNSLLIFLSLLVTHHHYTMEPIQATAPKQEKIECSICQDEIKEGKIKRTFSCKHPLCQECYSTLRATAQQENKKIVPCPICRIPIHYMHIGFTDEERHQVSQFLHVEGLPPATIENAEIRQRVITFREQLDINDEGQIDDQELRKWLSSHLELQAVRAQIPYILTHCADLERQIDTALKQYMNDQAKITFLSTHNPTPAFAFLITQFERKDAFIEKLQEYNKILHAKFCKNKKKRQEQKSELRSEWAKARLALSTLIEMHSSANQYRAGQWLIKVSSLGYAAHKGARMLQPDSTLCDVVSTCAVIGFMGFLELRSNQIQARQEKAVIDALKGAL